MNSRLQQRLIRLEPRGSETAVHNAIAVLERRINAIAARLPPDTPVPPDVRDNLRAFFISKGWGQ